MKLEDIGKIDSIEDYESKKAFFLSIEIPDIEAVKNTDNFIRYLNLFSTFQEHSRLNEITRKCNFSEQEIKKYNLQNIIKIRRVSWDDNLTEIKVIEGRIKKQKNNEVVYEFDIEKIQNCDKEKIRKILHELSFIELN